MSLHQLSVFLENKPGRLLHPCKVLAEAGINILTLSLADTEQFGILRLIVRDWQRARAALEASGCVVKVTEVVAVEVAHQPGGLAQVLQCIEECSVNVEYMYAFAYKSHEETGILLFCFDNPALAVRQLRAGGIRLLEGETLYERL